MLTVLSLVGVALAAGVGAGGQSSPPTPTAAKPEDVASIPAIMGALYDVISGPAGEQRDWDRMRSLFLPDAKMGLTSKRPDGTVGRRAFTVEEYIAQNAMPMEESGFFEKEIAIRVEQFGQIAHVFSTYEARRTEAEEKPFMRGINSLQLWNDGKRWWILSLFWQAESPASPLPEKYLKDG